MFIRFRISKLVVIYVPAVLSCSFLLSIFFILLFSTLLSIPCSVFSLCLFTLFSFFQYDDADRNIRNTIFDSPFTSEEIVKGTALLRPKNASGCDSISTVNEMIKANLQFCLSFLVYLIRFYKLRYTQSSGLGE